MGLLHQPSTGRFGCTGLYLPLSKIQRQARRLWPHKVKADGLGWSLPQCWHLDPLPGRMHFLRIYVEMEVRRTNFSLGRLRSLSFRLHLSTSLLHLHDCRKTTIPRSDPEKQNYRSSLHCPRLSCCRCIRFCLLHPSLLPIHER